MMNIKKFTQKDRHGNMFSFEFYNADVPEMEEIPAVVMIDHPGEPRGSDTVPAWLTPGEFVINAEATEKYEPILEEINDEGRAIQATKGQMVPEYAASGKKITERVMPNGKIGLWRGNTYLGTKHEDEGMLESIAKSLCRVRQP